MAIMTAVKALPIVVGALDDALAGELVVGRSDLVARLWATVREHCVRVGGARHMGKTWTLKLAAAEHPSWATPILLDAGTCQTVPELVYRTAEGLCRRGFVPRDWAIRVGHWHAKLSNHDPQEKPAAQWTMVLSGTLQHASVQHGSTTPTLILDGFGAFVDRLCRCGSNDVVRKLLDAIAAFPSDWPRLRCVVSGGSELDDALHAVYGDPSQSALIGALAPFDVPPLAHDDAHYLAACLLTGESVPCSDLHDVAEAVATASGEMPFLIHNTIDWMARFQPGMWTPERVRDVPTALWNESTDADDTNHPEVLIQKANVDDDILRVATVLDAVAPYRDEEPIVVAKVHPIAPKQKIVLKDNTPPSPQPPAQHSQKVAQTPPAPAAKPMSAPERPKEIAAKTPVKPSAKTVEKPSAKPAQPAPATNGSKHDVTPVEKPANGTKRSALTLPPAFMLLRKDKLTAAANTAAAAKRSDFATKLDRAAAPPQSNFERDWRRIQPYIHAAAFAPTTPASFYVTHLEPDAMTEHEKVADPPSFVALEPMATPPGSLKALADAKQALIALELTPPAEGIENDQTLFAKGTTQIQRGQYSAAASQLQEVARRADARTQAELGAAALVNMSYALARLHRYEECVGVCDTLTRQFGEDTRPGVLACVAVGLVNKASCLTSLGRSAEAADVCAALLTCAAPEQDSVLGEALLSARFNLAHSLAQLGNENEALEEYLEVARECRGIQIPSFQRLGAEAHYNAAVLHHRTARRVETIEACDAALAMNATHVRAHALRAASYLQLHLVGEALVAMSDAFNAFPMRSVQRALILAEVIAESSQSAVLLRTVATTCAEDPGALACALLLWLRRQMPINRAKTTPLGVVEHALRGAASGTTEIAPVLDAMRALRRSVLGDPHAFDHLRDDIRSLLRANPGR